MTLILRRLALDRTLLRPLGIFVVARILLSAVAGALWLLRLVPTTPDPVMRPYADVEPVVQGVGGWLLGVWQRFDAIHYMRIASGGYSAIDLTGFYPLYPFLARLIMPVAGNSPLFALLLVSNVACLAAAVTLYKLTLKEGRDTDTATRAVLYLFFFPTGFLLLAPYTESLFLMASLITFHEARRRRWISAGIAGLAASLTRVQGVVLALVLLVEMAQAWRQSRSPVYRPWSALGHVAVGLAPVIGGGLFLAWRQWAGYPPITRLASEYWRSIPVFPFYGIVVAVQRLLQGNMLLWVDYLNLAATVLMLGLGVAVLRRLPISYGLYFWAVLTMNLSNYRLNAPLDGRTRYALVLFPAFIVLAGWGRSPWANRLILYSFTALYMFCAGQFVMWGWIG